MSGGCVFCGIAAGETPARIVHEDEATIAFLDINPLAEGHTLVVPKAHRERVSDLSAAEMADLFRAVAEVVPAVEAGVDAPASTIAVNNGPEAGQEVPHLHVHVVPRWPDDSTGPIHALFRDVPDLDGDELDAIAEAIASEV